MEVNEREKPYIRDLNEHIVCPLCRGYLIDATTLVECLHSFCRGCIVRRLSSGARACPACNVATSPPLLPDPRLQRLVYLVVPGLFRSELERRRHFRMVNPQCPPLAPPLGALDLTLDDFMSLSLCELDESSEESSDRLSEDVDGTTDCADERKRDASTQQGKSTRYLKCPAGVTVRHLVRLLMLKRGWEEANAGVNIVNRIEMMCEEYDKRRQGAKEMRPLDPSWTLLDLACIFGWKREAPMRLFYRVLGKHEAVSTPTLPPYDDDDTSKDSPSIENIQRPPTPPPSPKPVADREPEARRSFENDTAETARAIENEADRERDAKTARAIESEADRERDAKTKKPRCEVTPVMRAPEAVGPTNHHASEGAKTKELARLEHRKRRKRRNKRVIAEITTTPREDLLKLKVRLTPCPPRITSSAGSGQAKEKLLQMRAVRREKIKSGTMAQQRSSSALTREEGNGVKTCATESEETIEEIIDGIPDEVVRIAQNIATPAEEVPCAVEKSDQKLDQRPDQKFDQRPDQKFDQRTDEKFDQRPDQKFDQRPDQKFDQKSDQKSAHQTYRGASKAREEPEPEVSKSSAETGQPIERPKKDEEILRRLGLVAINEASENLRDKSKQRAQTNDDKANDLDREKLEKQLRESKANRVRSLLAEKQMRDALKSIMSKAKDDRSSPAPQVTVTACPKKKGPPPLAPLRVAKSSSSFAGSTSATRESHGSKYESPLDLSSAGAANDNVLDLSAGLTAAGSGPGVPPLAVPPLLSASPASSSSVSSSPSSFSASSSPSSSSSSSPSSCSMTSLPFLRPPRAAVAPGSFLRKSKELEQRRGQDTNLRTLSDAAVSLLGSCIADKSRTEPLVLSSVNIGPGKVALRIPQPHHRISGFGMKIKPNLGVRHIPNPQAVVASQYRNQRASYFNSVTQQPP